MPATAYTQQLIEKKQYIKTLFTGLAAPEWTLFESPEQHYRMRAEFRVWHEGEEMFYAMFTRGQKAGGGSKRMASLAARKDKIAWLAAWISARFLLLTISFCSPSKPFCTRW